MGLRFTENKNRSSGLSVTTNPRTAFSAHGLPEATQTEAEGGTITGRYMSPLRVAQAISALIRSVTNTWTAQQTFSAAINLTSGQIAFPATAVPSSDANTLDDYEEGTWTPVFTFATPGDLSAAYSSQAGYYTKIGNHVTLWWSLTTSSFTHTTASGALRITGLPFASAAGLNWRAGSAAWQGVTKANYTQVTPYAAVSASYLEFNISGSGQTLTTVQAGDTPTGGTLSMIGGLNYKT